MDITVGPTFLTALLTGILVAMLYTYPAVYAVFAALMAQS